MRTKNHPLWCSSALRRNIVLGLMLGLPAACDGAEDGDSAFAADDGDRGADAVPIGDNPGALEGTVTSSVSGCVGAVCGDATPIITLNGVTYVTWTAAAGDAALLTARQQDITNEGQVVARTVDASPFQTALRTVRGQDAAKTAGELFLRNDPRNGADRRRRVELVAAGYLLKCEEANNAATEKTDCAFYAADFMTCVAEARSAGTCLDNWDLKDTQALSVIGH